MQNIVLCELSLNQISNMYHIIRWKAKFFYDYLFITIDIFIFLLGISKMTVIGTHPRTTIIPPSLLCLWSRKKYRAEIKKAERVSRNFKRIWLSLKNTDA